MELHFYTADLEKDYPEVGWLPALPGGADALWRNFGNLHAGAYPEIVLAQYNGSWQLYLSAIDSGRMDSITGTGRIIRISLYLSGTCSEGHAVAGLIAQYLRETMNRQDPEQKLKALFASKIKVGDPVKWKDLPEPEQKKIADDLLESLIASFPAPAAETAQPAKCWMGGCACPDALEKFVVHCRKLLSGEWDGMAISLAYLSSSEIGRALRSVKQNGTAAVLLSVPDEKDRPYRALQEKQSTATTPTPPVKPTVVPFTNSNRRKNGAFSTGLAGKGVLFWWLGGLLLLGGAVAIVIHSFHSEKEEKEVVVPVDSEQGEKAVNKESTQNIEALKQETKDVIAPAVSKSNAKEINEESTLNIEKLKQETKDINGRNTK